LNKMMPYGDEDDEMEEIDPSEHMNELNLRQKATVAQAVANQKKYDDLRAEYRKELDALDAKYKALEVPIFQERCKIVGGEVGLEDVKLSPEKLEEMKGQEAHLPNFWFHVLRNNGTIRALCGLSDSDKECMSYISDVVCEAIPLTEEEVEVTEDDDDECECEGECKCKEKNKPEEEKKVDDPKPKKFVTVQKRGFKVIFRFKEGNPYFPETELSKTYHLIQHPMEDEPGFDGIDTVQPTWNEGKNLTKKTVTKTVKSKAKGKGKKPVTKKVTTEEPCASFFNFFTAPEVPKDMSTLDEEEAAELQSELQTDLEVGQVLCEDVIPRAILWYTGVACEDGDDDEFGDFDDEDGDEDGDDDDDDDDDEDDDDEEDEEDEVDEGDDEEGKGKAKAAGGANQETPEECKQQ